MTHRQLREEEQRKREQVQKNLFLEGLRRYQSKGIPILIDGKESGPEDLRKIVEVREDGSFYMGDYVSGESGKLTEIHFDKVYHR